MTLTIAVVLAFTSGGLLGLFAMALAAASSHAAHRQHIAYQEQTIRMLAAERDRLTRRVGDLAARRGQK